MLRLITNSAGFLKGNALSQGRKMPPLRDSFLADFQEFSPNLYAFRARDCKHDLLCEINLEVKEIFVSLEEEDEEEAYLAPVVACNFSTINTQKFHKKTGLDGYLQGILLHQFHLRILEQLLSFCGHKDAIHLTFIIKDTDLDYLEIYSRFFASEKQVTTANGEQTQVVIPTDVDTYDEIINFMDKLDRDFRKTLWREQNSNPAFREYLKTNACL
jgi:hypothetical protein